MSFTDAVKACFSNYCNFKGRARRSEYWYFTLLNIIITAVLSLIQTGLRMNGNSSSPLIVVCLVLQYVYSFAVLLPGLGVGVRRLHDTGRSGWFYLLMLIPLVGAIVVIIFFAQDSQPGTNKYGPNPKGVGNEGIENNISLTEKLRQEAVEADEFFDSI